MTPVGQREILTQQRVIAFFRDALGYTYLGHWKDRPDNANVEETRLRRLARSARATARRSSARRCSSWTRRSSLGGSKTLYDANREVYGLLRYGVKVKPEVGEQNVTVWLIDWKQPGEQRLRHRRGGHGLRRATPSGRTSSLYVNGIALGVLELKRSTVSVTRGHPAEPRQPEEGVHPALLRHGAAGHGGQRHRGAALRRRSRRRRSTGCAGRKPMRTPSGRQSAAARAGPALPQGAAAGARPRLHGLRRRHQEDLPAQPVLRRQGGAGARAAPRGRHHLAHPGQRQEPDMVWLAKWIREHVQNSRVLIITDRDRTGRADREGVQGRRRGDLPHQERRRPGAGAQRQRRMARSAR